MKRIFIIAGFFLLVFTGQASGAVSVATLSPSLKVVSPTISSEEKEIHALKEKIATKVAQLRKQNNKAISGKIQEIKDNTFKIITQQDEEFEIKIDSALTKFFDITTGVKKEIKLAAVEKGDYIVVTGMINGKIVDANFIYLDQPYLLGWGKVAEINKASYYLLVTTPEKENYTLDIETYTKEQILNIKTLEVEKAGFSKIKEGDTIHFVVKGDFKEAEPNRYSAQKILIIPQEYFLK